MKARKRKPGFRFVPDPTDPKEKKAKGRSGSAAVIKRNKKGDLEATKKGDFAGISAETLKEDRQAKAGTGTGYYDGAPAPRVGGVKVEKKDGPVMGGSRPQLRKAKRRARRSSASKTARRSAIRLY